MKQNYEDAVLKVVSFWSDKSFRAVINQNNGAGGPQGLTTFILMNQASELAKDQLTQENIDKFENKLIELLMELEDEPQYRRDLDVDYHPNKLLAKACEYAGVNPMCLPCKTWTSIDENNVATAKYQYGNKPTTL